MKIMYKEFDSAKQLVNVALDLNSLTDEQLQKLIDLSELLKSDNIHQNENYKIEEENEDNLENTTQDLSKIDIFENISK